MLEIPIQTALTDSLSVSIPIEDVEVLDARLLDAPILYYPSIDHFEKDQLPNTPIVKENNGIKIRFSIFTRPHAIDKEIQLKFLKITVNSKLLHERYFDGITAENIHVVYERLIEYNVVMFCFETFLNSTCNDIDVCYNDYVASLQHFSRALDLSILDSLDRHKYLKKFWNEGNGNYGLSFNQRLTARPSTPFIKLYHKEHELINRSPEFWNTYLYKHFSQKIKGLTRVEATIKNYAHKKRLERYGILPPFKTLKEFLLIPEKSLKDFICFSASAYVGKQYRNKAYNLSPMDYLLYELIQTAITSGVDESYFEILISQYKGTNEKSDDVAKSRMRKKVNELKELAFAKDIKLKNQYDNANEVNSYLQKMGFRNNKFK